MIDLAADRSVDPGRRLSGEELDLAVRHGLVGVLGFSDDPRLSTDAFPALVRLEARQQAMRQVTRRILEALASEDIPATVVKGPAVADWAYRTPGHRTFTDIDLLVPRERIQSTLDVLDRHPNVTGIPPKTPDADKRNIPVAHESGVRFTLDLHWDLFSYTQLRGCATGAADEGWRRATYQPDHQLGPSWELPDDTRIAFLSTHALLDHRFRLILFRDLLELARTRVDWEAFVDFAFRHRLRSFTYLAWYLARLWLDAQIPDGVLGALRPRSLALTGSETLAQMVDPVMFDGHRPHPLNLSIVLLNDDPVVRRRLAVAAPFAFPRWLDRVEEEHRAAERRRSAERPVPAVVHLLPQDLSRGAQAYARVLRDELDEEAVRHRSVAIFTSGPGALHPDYLLGARVAIGRRVGFSPLAAWRLRRLLTQMQPDAVIAHGGEALKYLVLCGRSGATRSIYYKVGTYGDMLEHRFRRAFHRFLANRADIVVAISDAMLDELAVLRGIESTGIPVIPNGRDPAVYHPDASGRAGGSLQVMAVGAVDDAKRPEWFVDTVRALRDRGHDIVGTWVGDGPLLDSMRAAPIEGVEFLGRRDDVPELLRDVDLVVLPSEAEGMPGVLIEAGLTGLPVVTTAAAGAADIVEHGVTGLVTPVDDVEVFVDSVELLVVDGELRRSMGEAARTRCCELFTLDRSVALWRDVLDEGLGASR